MNKTELAAIEKILNEEFAYGGTFLWRWQSHVTFPTFRISVTVFESTHGHMLDRTAGAIQCQEGKWRAYLYADWQRRLRAELSNGTIVKEVEAFQTAAAALTAFLIIKGCGS